MNNTKELYLENILKYLAYPDSKRKYMKTSNSKLWNYKKKFFSKDTMRVENIDRWFLFNQDSKQNVKSQLTKVRS